MAEQVRGAVCALRGLGYTQPRHSWICQPDGVTVRGVAGAALATALVGMACCCTGPPCPGTVLC